MSYFNQLNIASIQMVSGTHLDKNLELAAVLIRNAKDAGAQMIVLPEYFAIMGEKETDKLSLVESHGDGKVQSFLALQAQKHSLWVVGGTHPIQSDNPLKPYARCYVYNSEGKPVCYYDKIHLFDVLVQDKQKNYQESLFCKAGNKVVVFKSPWGKIGLAVCYDIRFPELFRSMIQQKVKLILLPAAFTYATGKLHWEILLRARAIENQSYVIASAQGGRHENGRETWGHSCIISPLGEILSCFEIGAGFITTKLDFVEQKRLRREFPVLSHQKL